MANTVEQKTPFELCFGKKPDVSNLKIFGSYVYVRIPEQKRKSKIDPKAEKGKLIGYVENGYRVLINGKIRESSYVRLAENKGVNDEKEENIYRKTSEPSRTEKPSEQGDTETFFYSRLDGDNSDDEEKMQEQPELQNREPDDENQVEILPDSVQAPDQLEEAKEEIVQAPAQEVETPGRPPRDRKIPGRFEDYIIQVKLCTKVYSPEKFSEAMSGEDAEKWKISMDEEMENLRRNNVWTLVKPPSHCKIIPLKWVFRVKPTGKYKSRVVAVGYRQPFQEGEETYSPVAAMTTLRAVLSVACRRGYHIHQMDVEAAFLNGRVKGEVYVSQPKGYESGNGMVYKLNKALYGLRESPRAWYDCFHQFILGLGFRCSGYDSCLYYKRVSNGLLGLILYVDDLLIFSQDLGSVVELKSQLKEKFRMTDLGEVKNYLGITVKYDRQARTMTLSQEEYIASLAKKYRTDNMRTYRTPMEKNLNLSFDTKPDDFISDYRRLIGALLYVSSGTRLDVSFAVNYLSRFQKCATGTHFKYALRVLKYLQETKGLKLTFHGGGERPIDAWADADWAADTQDRKSTGGILVRIFENPVVWICKKQKSVARASTYAEYVALADAVSELFSIEGILTSLAVKVQRPIVVFEDNSSAITLANKGKFAKPGKHIEVSYKFVADYVAKGFVKVQKVDSRHQLADVLTKAVSHERFLELRLTVSIR